MAFTQSPTPSFAGLQAGRLVNYVTKNGHIRPLLVLVAFTDHFPSVSDPAAQELRPTGLINGIVFRDGSNDASEFGDPPQPVSAEQDAEAVKEFKSAPPRLAEWVTSVHFDGSNAHGETPGTWHWPAKNESLPFVSQKQLDATLELVKDDITEACSDLLVSDSFKMTVNQLVDAALSAAVESRVKALAAATSPDAVVQAVPAMADLSNRIDDINVKLLHHGITGPASESLPAPDADGEGADGAEYQVGRHTDVFSQPANGGSVQRNPLAPPTPQTATALNQKVVDGQK